MFGLVGLRTNSRFSDLRFTLCQLDWRQRQTYRVADLINFKNNNYMFPVHFANVVLFIIALSLALKHPEIIWIRLETNPVPWDKSTPTRPPCHGCRIQKFLSWSSKKFLSLQHSSNSLSSSLLSEKDDWVRLTSAQQVSPLKIGDGWDQTLKKCIIKSLLLGYPDKWGLH